MANFNKPAPLSGAVRPSLEQFRAVSSIFDAAEIVLYVADMETYELLFLNAHAERLWGPKVGKRCYEVLQAGQSGPCEFCTNSRLIERGRAAPPVVWEFQNTVNKRWYLCIDKAIPWSDARLVRMEVAIDITERKAHEQFREHYMELISHGLRTPISAIGLSASELKLVLGRAALAGAGRPVDAILRNTRQMAEMIDDLLQTTRLESAELQLHRSSFDLAQFAGTVVAQLGAAASRLIHFEARGTARVLADAELVEHVLEHLVDNACRYSPPDSPVGVHVEADEKEAVVTVADRGAGISADELPKLFQRFFRASDKRFAHGMGLGLYNSRLIIERHGGRIWAESSPGAGSTFRFTLPRALAETASV